MPIRPTGSTTSSVRVTTPVSRQDPAPFPSSSHARWLTPESWHQEGLNSGTSVPPAGKDASEHPSKARFDLCQQSSFVFCTPATCCFHTSSFLVEVLPGQHHLSMQRAVSPDMENLLAMTLKPLGFEQSHKQLERATDPRSSGCMLNGKGLQKKTKLRAAGTSNAKTEALTQKTTFFSASKVSESATHKHGPRQCLHCRSPASTITLRCI